ncbi:MAG: EAL domain-containing protein [Silicimonas sp.]|nr:EAL domain-containing protein [Silicimonas sp.]
MPAPRPTSNAPGYGLGRKLTFTFGGLISIFVVAVVFLNVQIQIELVRQRVELRSQQLVRLGVEVSLPYLLDGRPAELEAIFEEISAQRDVAHVYLLDKDGHMLVDGADVEVTDFLAPFDDPFARRALAARTQLREITGNLDRFAHPILLGDAHYGTLRLDIRRDTLRSELVTVWTRNAYVGVFFIFLGLATSSALARRLTTPLIHLTRATERAAAGELDQKIDVETNDEIESLAHSFAQMLGTMRDHITQIQELAYVDKLTQIPNRAWFSDQIEAKTMDPHTPSFAVMFLDIDNFKTINDRYGHDVGDVLLTTFAQRLAACLADEHLSMARVGNRGPLRRNRALLARLGGDEFTLILPTFAAENVARRIIAATHAPIEVGKLSFTVTTSIGIGLFPDQGRSAHDLLKIADTAMYQAKQAGRNCYRIYNDSLHQAEIDREEMQSDLSAAIAAQALEIHLQPQFETATGRVSGAEVLLRWHHPRKGLLSPDTFLPLAATRGLLPAIGRETTRLAIEAATRIQLFSGRPFVLAVNLSADEIMDADLISELVAQVRRAGVDPAGIEIEITEDTAMVDDRIAADHLAKLRALGLRLAIDDFGVGFSNLARLKNLAFDTLKIDRSLLADVDSDPGSARLVTMIIELAHAIHADVVAEGVETEAQRAFLAAQNCRHYQGYLGGRPMPAPEFEDWLRAEYQRDAARIAPVPIGAEHR